MIDCTIRPDARNRTAERARARAVLIPTFEQLTTPSRVPPVVRRRLQDVSLSAVDPANLFRISWHNDPRTTGGLFGGVNFLEFPPALTGVPARIIGLAGKWFPTGAHKVGAAFGCLVPPLVTGQFDPERQKAVWPSTGNFCRGGAYDSALLGCESVAVLPEGMSRERFEWLAAIAGTVIKTPGSESNVKEIFDECQRLRREDDAFAIFNQFEAFGNYLWHHRVTGGAMLEVLDQVLDSSATYRGLVLATGSAGTLASGDRLKEQFPNSKIAVIEALQCPTLLLNGYGAHRIEGIGDKHVPWIHNVRATDLIIDVDDRAALAATRLFNEEAGLRHLASRQVSEETLGRLPLVGISGAANLLGCIKFARWYHLGPEDVILTVLTDSIDLYRSRLDEWRAGEGALTDTGAATIHARDILGASTDAMEELTEASRRRIHNLKYFTWVEQQGKSVGELDAQWDDPTYWKRIANQQIELDALIDEFNARSGLLDSA
jgi:cysteine synthase A